MSVWIRPLSGLSLADTAQVGGKAAGLGEALRHGARIPPGFVLLPQTFIAVLRHNRLYDAWDAAVRAARRDDFGPAESLAPRVAAMSWPDDLNRVVGPALAGLGATRLAVRSSATMEDGTASAAAGVFTSVLDVEPVWVAAAANHCWASALVPAVFAHLLAMGLDPGACHMAVVIQPMRAAEFAGVLFTVDPTDPDHTHMRLAFVRGKGEAVVQGESGLDVRVPRVGPFEGLPDALPLEGRHVARLRRMALRLENGIGRPLDIEWVVVNGDVELVQARPIVGLEPGSQRRPAIRWSRDLAEERFPDPISPLGWSALGSALRVNLDTLDRRFGLRAERPDEVATVIGGYVYNNRDFFAIPGALRFRPGAFTRYIPAMLGGLAALLSPLAVRHWPLAFAPRRGPLGAGPLDPRFRALAAVFENFVFVHADEVEDAWKGSFPVHMAAMDALDAEDVSAMDLPTLLDYADQVIACSDRFMEPDLAIYAIKMACRWALEGVCALVDGQVAPTGIATLTGGLAANATLTMNEALDRLHTAVAGDRYLASAMRHGDLAAVHAAWERSPARAERDLFVAQYGHVTPSWDIRMPTYRDTPTLLDNLLTQRLRATHVANAVSHRAALIAAREAEAARLARGLSIVRWAPDFFGRLLATLHAFMRLDEEHHLFCGRLIPAERRIIVALARHFVAAGAIAHPDDIHFLVLDEVFALARELGAGEPWSRKRLVARRRRDYERAAGGKPVSDFRGRQPVVGDETMTPHSGEGDEGWLQGLAAGPGVVEGVVRVVTTMADMSAFRPGEILVTPTPKPSFTPLFALAGGIITARGSILSHGLISAREYGLPAVTEIPGLLDQVATGQRVRVDGHLGTVTLLGAGPDLPRPTPLAHRHAES